MRKLTSLWLCGALAACAPAPVAPVASDAAVTVDLPTAPADAAIPDSAATDVQAAEGGILPPSDVGNPFTDAGSLGEPPWVALEVRTRGTCTPLNACGGAEVGTWDVAGGCFEIAIEERLAQCPSARVTRSDGRARGRVTFASGFANRTAQWEVNVELFVPRLCAGFVGGCPGLQAALRPYAPDTTCVAEGAGDCRCASRTQGEFRQADAYSTQNNQIVSASSNRRWNYCVTNNRLRYQDATPSGALEPGIIELVRR